MTVNAVNVYDFDKTIYRGDCTVDFWKYCTKHYKKTFRAFPKTLLKAVPYFFGLCSKTEFKQTFFRFLEYVPDIDLAVKEFWDKHYDNIQPWYLEQKQSSDVIVSASPEFLLEPACKRLGVSVIGSRVGKSSGKFEGLNCHDTEKVLRFREEFPNVEIREFYSDSLSDAPLAELAQEAYLVCNDTRVPWGGYKPSFVKKTKQMFLSKDFLLFVFCGGVGTLTNFICSLLISLFINPTIAYACGYALSLFVAYALNAALIFKEKLQALRFVKFVISYIPNFVILFAFVCIFLNIFGWNKVIVYALAALFGIPVTFVLVKLYAFKKSTVKGG